MKLLRSLHWMILPPMIILPVLAHQSCSRDEPNSDKAAVTFGAVLPLTGEVANWGKDSSNGIILAIDEANRSSTNYRFKVVFEDSKGRAAEAVAAARKLITADNVAAIIGDNVSGPTIAIVPIADEARIPVISPSASSPALTGMSDYFFRVYPSDTAEGGFMAQVASERLGLQRVSILYINNDFGVGLRDVFSTVFGNNGGEITGSHGYNEDQTDFRPYLARIENQAPDGIYLAGYYKDGGAILKQAKELGLNATFLGSTTHEDPQLLTLARDSAEGFLYPYSTGYDEDSSAESVTHFRLGFQQAFDREPGLVAALGYDCAQLLVDAVEGGGPSSDAIRDFLANTRNYKGATGAITFDENGDVKKPILLKTVRAQSFAPLTE